jgi:RecJ-like exonuclease
MGFCDDVKGAAETITAADSITIISHIDADGIASEAILSQAVSRAEIPNRSVFVRQLEPLTMPQVPMMIHSRSSLISAPVNRTCWNNGAF